MVSTPGSDKSVVFAIFHLDPGPRYIRDTEEYSGDQGIGAATKLNPCCFPAVDNLSPGSEIIDKKVEWISLYRKYRKC